MQSVNLNLENYWWKGWATRSNRTDVYLQIVLRKVITWILWSRKSVTGTVEQSVFTHVISTKNTHKYILWIVAFFF